MFKLLLKNITQIVLIVLFITGCVNNVYATDNDKTPNLDYLNEQEIKWLKEHPVLKVHNETHWSPYNFYSNGEASGFSIEYMNMIADKAGFEIEYIHGPTWNEFLSMMQSDELDIMLNIVKTPEREKYLLFSSTYSVLSIALAIKKEDKDIFTLKGIGNKSVCLPNGSSMQEFLSVSHPDMNLRPRDDVLACLRAVENSEVDVALDGEGIFNYLVSEHGLTDLHVTKIAVESAKASILRIATRKDLPILRNIIDKTMNELDKIKVNKLHAKWLEIKKIEENLDFQPALLNEFELAWVKEHPIIRVHNEMNWPPFNYNQNGEAKGYSIDFMNLVADKVGLKVEYVSGPTWQQFLDMIQADELDVMINITPTSERKQYLAFTNSYLTTFSAVVVKDPALEVRSLQDLYGKRVAAPKGFFTTDYLAREHPDIDLVLEKDTLGSIYAVLEGRADAMLDELPVVDYLIAKHTLTGLRHAFITRDPNLTSTQSMGVPLKKRIIRDILQKGIDAIDDTAKAELREKWLSEKEVTVAAQTPNTMLALLIGALGLFALLMLLNVISRRFSTSDEEVLQTGTLRFRILIFGFLSIFVVLVVIIGSMALSSIKEKILSDVTGNLENMLVTTADRLAIWVDSQQGVLEQIAMNPILNKQTQELLNIATNPAVLLNSDELLTVRNTLAYNQADLGLGYFIIDRNGISIGSARDINVGTINLIAEQKPALLARVFAGESVFVPPIYTDLATGDNKDNSATGLFIAVPIQRNNDEVIAALMVRLDPARGFSRVLQFSRIAETGETYAFDQFGTMLSASRFEEDLREIGLLDDDQSSIMNVQIRDPGGNMTQGFRSNQPRADHPLTLMADRAISAGITSYNERSPSESDMSGYRDYRGVPVYGTWLWMGHLGLGLSSEIDVAEALSTYDTVRLTAISILVITLFLSLGGTLFTLVTGERTNKALKKARDELEDRVEDRTQELQKATRQTEQILNNATDGILTFNDKQLIVGFNPACEYLWGYSAAEVLGQDISMLIPEHAESADLFTETRGLKLLGRKKNGVVFPAEVGISKNEIDEESFYSAFVNDITEREKAEAEILEAKNAADAANQAKSVFLANMSHELRSPMNAIIGLSDLALRTSLTPKQQDYLNKVHSSTNTLLGIINDILDFSKIEAGMLDLELISFSLDEVLESLAAMVSLKTQEKGLELLFSRDSAVPANLLGDPLRLGQILLNLSNNAVKFTEQGEVLLRINLVNQQADRAMIRFSIEDTGIGMSPDYIDKLFQSFTQADTSTSRKYGGTGLGLAISKQLVEMMGGKIWIESELGKGSKFIFDINLEIDPDPQVKMLSSDLDGLKVLVVDDNRHCREILEQYLNDFGLEVECVATAEEAFEILTGIDRPFDLVLMDFIIPNGMDGVTATKHIKQKLNLKKVPKVILVTAYGYGKYADMDGAAMLDNELNKPVNPSLLLDTIMATFDIQTLGNVRGSKQRLRIDNEALDKIRGAKILLVEDNVLNQQVVTELLEQEFFVVDVANNGKEAIEDFDLNKYDCVLMDIQMPIMDGYTTTRLIREKEEYADLPILAITANATKEDKEATLASGMNDHITKPIKPSILLNTLVKWIKPGVREILEKIEIDESNFLEGRTAEIDRIKGLSIEEGLKHVNGNKNLLYKLIIGFFNDHQNILLTIENALSKENFEEALRASHTLKGIAGTIGALSVQEHAGNLELAIKNNKKELYESGLNSLAVVLQPLFDQLKLVTAGSSQNVDDSQNYNLESLETVCEKIVTLALLLEEMNPESEEQTEDLISSLKGYNQNDLLSKLKKQVSDFDYGEAQKTLDLVKQNITDKSIVG